MTTMIDARFNTIDLKIDKMALTLPGFGSLITLWARVGLH
jgi:hypothetical protein